MTASASKFAKAQGEQKAFELEKAKGAEANAKYVKSHSLALDTKLRRSVSIVEIPPKLSHLLDRLSVCTGLKFTLAENLTYHDPDLGELAQPKVAGYSVMEIIARKDIEDGRWEKTDDGYRLEGVSRALRPPPKRYGWAWTTGGVLLALATAGGTFVIYRRRSKQPATSPSPATIALTVSPSTPTAHV